MDLNKLRIFLAAARLQNYTLAGRQLNLSQSAVSHGIRRLEESLGQRLVEWRARRFHLTAEGERLLEVCEDVFRRLDDAEAQLLGGDPRRVRVTLGVTVEFGTTVLVPWLAPRIEAEPRLHVDFVFSNHLERALQRREIDLAVDCKPHQQTGLVRTPLFREKYVVVAAPGYLARRPVEVPRDLADASLLSLDRDLRWWRNVYEVLPGAPRPGPDGVVLLTHVRGIVHAALAGMGLGLVPKYTILDELAAGLLVEVFPGTPFLDDEFCVYQWRGAAGQAGSQLLVGMLEDLPVADFGDALSPPGEGPAP